MLGFQTYLNFFETNECSIFTQKSQFPLKSFWKNCLPQYFVFQECVQLIPTYFVMCITPIGLFAILLQNSV